MTMSTNLGWPSEPDPEPEHRRLGWLARMLGVSRETTAPDDAHPGRPAGTVEPLTSAQPSPTAGETSPAPLVADAPAQPDLAVEDLAAVVPASESASDPDDGPTVSAPRESPALSQGVDARGDAGGSSSAVGHRPEDEARAHADDGAEGESRADDENRADNEAAPVNPAGDTAWAAEPGSPEEQMAEQQTEAEDAVQDLDAVRVQDGGDVVGGGMPESGAAVMEAGHEPSPAGPDSSFRVDEVDRTAAPEPVDNAVDEGVRDDDSERENRPYRAGDNVVDESLDTMRQLADHADREALVAALPTPGSDTPLARELAENARRRIQLTGRPFPKPVSPRVLTVANQKGGVGKTTTTVNVAAALAQAGLSVLVIDLDPQGNASTALGIDHHAEVPSIYDVLVDGTPMLEVVQPCSTVENLHCAPATIDLAGAEIELVSLVARESRLQKAIAAAAEQGHSYDYILIDCPPSLGLLTVNAMVAASEVFIPIQCEYYALEGLSQLLKNIDLVKRHLNPALHVSTILLTMYDGRTRLSAQVADEVREHFPEQVLRTTVPRSVRVSEAPSFGETVMTYDPASSGALAYLEAAGELADRGAAGRD